MLNSDANQNTASGTSALALANRGSGNTANGYQALYSNSASFNSAVGDSSLYSNTSGANNTAFGSDALYRNTTGKGNAAQGANALYNNTTGIRNLGIGSNALFSSNGSYNIALGFDAGYNVTSGSNNIEIGTEGGASDNNTIQIGVQGTQTLTTIAGIFGTPVTGSAVYVTPEGQLGVQASSERYKTDIRSLADQAARLEQLRPVSFHLKTDPGGAVQYGLIAEEVAKVYPELVIRDHSGQIQGVRYEQLAPMLLGQMKHERKEAKQRMAALTAQFEQRAAAQDAAVLELKRSNEHMQKQLAELSDLKQALHAAIRELRSNAQLVAAQ